MRDKRKLVKGLSLGSTYHKIAAYADDLLFVLTQPHISIPNLLKDFELFGYISNFKISYEKSEALNISLNSRQLQDAKSNCPFKWVDFKLKYLVIWLTPELDSLYTQLSSNPTHLATGPTTLGSQTIILVWEGGGSKDDSIARSVIPIQYSAHQTT